MKTLVEEFEDLDKQAEIASKQLKEEVNTTLVSIDNFNKELASYLKEIGTDNIKRVYIGNNIYYKEDFEKWV